jgi:uncharacterized membrane protein required for colicin V production
MIGNLLKIIGTLIAGYLFGYVFGAILGAALGAIPSLFFREIVSFNQTILMSVTLSMVLGGLLAFIATKMINKLWDTDDKPFSGIIMGIVVGLVVVLFVDGVTDLQSSDNFREYYYMWPVIYGGILGTDIGSTIFAILSATAMARDIKAEAADSKKRMDEIRNRLPADTNPPK